MEPIAIIGIGCRFPGAKSPEAFWQLLHDGVDAITEVPGERWDIDALYDPNPATPGKMSTRWGGFLEQVDQFDAQFFGITSREASSMDPQQRLLLEVAWEALEDAGQIPEHLSNTPTGVFVGISCYDYSELIFKAHGPGDPYAGTGNTLCIAANRLSYVFDFRGPSLAVDTACSSSLVAVNLACRSLWQGECIMALAGGVNVILSPQININFTKAGFLANDGRCKTFDARANGYVRSEGAGVVILKPLSQALSDGDSIYAVIRGGAVNQDGRTNGLMAPNRWAQEAVLREAYLQAGVPPSQVQYVEAHGTGTLLGDPIEMKALGAVLATDRPPGHYCAVGSVKTNIGHLEAAAGIAALIKVALSLKHRQIPPSLHFQKPNPHIPFDDLPLRVQQTLEPWPEESRKAIAGVSSFGFGGTNAHVVLEEAPWESQKAVVQQALERPQHLLTLSAKSEKALLDLARLYQVFLSDHPAEYLENVCFTTNSGRTHFAHRLAIAAESTEQLTEQLGALITGDKPTGLVSGHVKSRKRPPQIAFLFSGQGVQYLGMGRQIYDTQPTFRKALERCDELLRPYLEQPLLSVLFPASDDSQTLNHVETLHVTSLHTQLALFALEYALAELWRSWGIVPDIVMGHSLGEYVAACVAGVFSLEDGLKLIAERGRLIQTLPQDGIMAAVFADEARVVAAIVPHSRIAIAAVNGPRNTVISGDRTSIEAVLEQLRTEGIDARPLQVSHAFHSPLMEPMLDNFEQLAVSVQFAAPRIPLLSNLTGQILSLEEIPDATYWRRHLRETVQFAAGMHTLAEQGYDLFIEIGPHATLLAMGKHCLSPSIGTWLPSLHKGKDNWWVLLNSLATLYVKGVNVNWAGFNCNYQLSKVSLPTYPFERKRYWIESAETMDIKSTETMDMKKLDTKSSNPQIDTTFKNTQGNTTSKIMQGDSLRSKLLSLVTHWLPIDPNEIDIYASFLEMGADSILLLEAIRSVENTFGIKLEIRQFFEELTTIDALITYIEQNISPEWNTEASPQSELEPSVLSQQPELKPSVLSQQPESEPSKLPQQLAQPAVFNLPVTLSTDKAVDRQNERRVSETALEGIIGQQIQLMSQQLDLLRNNRTEQPLLAETKPAESFEQSVSSANPPARASLRFAMTTTASPTSASAQPKSNQPVAELSRRSPEYMLSPREVNERILPQLDHLISQANLEVYGKVWTEIESLSVAYVVRAFQEMGWKFQINMSFSAEQMEEHLGVVKKNRRLLARLLGMLAKEGMLQRIGSQWEIVKLPEIKDPQEQMSTLLAQYPDVEAELVLLQRCGSRLAEVLLGECDPLNLLFPEGDLTNLTKLYHDSPGAQVMNTLVQKVVSSTLERLPQGREVRVLEIGAGTGGTTSYILPHLPARQTEYVFTDISPSLLNKAQKKFHDYPFVRYQVLDIEEAPKAQKFDLHQHDLIVAANVLHATKDLRQTLEHVRQLLAPGGMLVLLESTDSLHWLDVTFGLTEGWQKFTDLDLRPSHPLLSASQWLELLQESGFKAAVAISPDQESKGVSSQHVIVAQAPESSVRDRSTLGHTEGLSPRQQQYLDTFIAGYTKRTQGSKRQKQTYHPVLADKRVGSGFRPSTKEMVYPIVGQRSSGSKIWDVDGNEYIDISMGFGVHLFGHGASFIIEALEERIKEGIQIGPQSHLAGEVAELICELTGMERVTFCSTGTEAVMTAIRLARAVTGRTKIALFTESYHGQSDGVLVKPAQTANGKLYTAPMSLGVPPHMVEDTLVLSYGAPGSLDIIKAHQGELAAVLVEPVQSSRPNLQPKAFLQELRQLTTADGIALIFDEVITGFRLHPGGAQAWFGVEADIATYGKVVGGGLPIGVVAGKAAYMNAIDGGLWNYGDESYPQAETIFFGGTFNKNPLTMATTQAVLKHLKNQGSALQQQLNQRTSQLAETLNAYFKQENLRIQMVYCGSLFRFSFSGNSTEVYSTLEMDLFFYHLIENGVYTWEGRRFFLSTAHTDEDIDHLIQAVKNSIEEMRAGGFFLSKGTQESNGASSKATSLSLNLPNPTTVTISKPTQSNSSPVAAAANKFPVCSYNEWDPLEEVIVGIVDGAMIPSWHTIYRATVPPSQDKQLENLSKRTQTRLSYPDWLVQDATKCLQEFVHILESEGVVVRRPDIVDYSASFRTPAWEILNGFCAANPRDTFLVIGDEIIEAPMADRGRYFETWAYRSLLKEYSNAGAKWTAAPKPQLLDALYDPDYKAPSSGEDMRFVITEFEPTFDAADFVRLGRDIFVQKSHVTNSFGIKWLQRHLGGAYRVHVIESLCPQALHIDTTLVPLAPGKVLVNPINLDVNNLPDYFKSWDILIAPQPDRTPLTLYGTNVISRWVNMNVLSIDEERVIVEKSQESMIKALKDWGFKPIPCQFESFYPFLGSFHCATLDVRRRGILQSYS